MKKHKFSHAVNYPSISQVLHHAADRWLSPTGYPTGYPTALFRDYSCHAVDAAVLELIYKMNPDLDYDTRNAACETMQKMIKSGFRNMGLRTHLVNFLEFNTDYNYFQAHCDDRQGARYTWLKFAAMVAEEQGV